MSQASNAFWLGCFYRLQCYLGVQLCVNCNSPPWEYIFVKMDSLLSFSSGYLHQQLMKIMLCMSCSFFFVRACCLLILEANVDTMGKTDNLKHTICA
jgi:hypothetical protein